MRNLRRRRLSRPWSYGIAILGVLIVVITLVPLFTNSHDSGTSDAPLANLGRPTVAFMGDSYTAGTALGGQGFANYTNLIAARYNVGVYNAAVGGTGYIWAPENTRPFQEAQLERVVRVRPDTVVVVGSRNDGQVAGPPLGAAAGQLYDAIRTELPTARILVVGPIYSRSAVPPDVMRARDLVRTAAAARSLPFVDPISSGWFVDGNQNLISADAVHPNNAGHVHLADEVGQALVDTETLPTEASVPGT